MGRHGDGMKLWPSWISIHAGQSTFECIFAAVSDYAVVEYELAVAYRRVFVDPMYHESYVYYVSLGLANLRCKTAALQHQFIC